MSEFFEQLNSSATLVPPSVEDKEWFSSDGSTATRPVPGGANSARPRSAALALVLRRRQTSNSLDKSGRVDILFIKRAVNPRGWACPHLAGSLGGNVYLMGGNHAMSASRPIGVSADFTRIFCHPGIRIHLRDKGAVVSRDKWSGHVALPGGRQEVGESDLQTAVRECKEEVGVELVSRWVDMAHFYPKSDPCEVCFATSSMWRGSSRAHWKALLWLTRTEHLFIPCFHLPRPPLPSSASSPTAASPEPLTVVKTGAKATCVVDPHAGDTFVLWGLTFGVVSDLVAAAGGRRFAAEHPPYFRFHNLAADFALRLYYTLDSWDFCVIQAFVRERLTLPQLRR